MIRYKDIKGAARTISLFADLDKYPPKDYEPVFTAYEARPGLIDGRQTFVDLLDPTGYKWSMQYLGSYEVLKRMMKTKWFGEEVFPMWLDHLNSKLRSDAIVKIVLISEDPDVSDTLRLNACKYLAERPYEQMDLNKQKKRGRPSKEEVKGELKKWASMDEETQEEYKRVGLTIVGGKDVK